ncbi:membrane translocase subunit TIM22 [Seminavis robusta]|uniref:Mitochondrial import inner membrane translocase subunit TIM22 n=1 Tax=Seminavis robusta TaxID=568900 RepID=A0A9N8H1X9_9STRA|nr:membrane translocase subunit TIM22 [Seminavis robusta]|eukprot:Sro1_g000680.1 membrane translocase subunit TIM22 (235) ;mRNA; r:195362-196066
MSQQDASATGSNNGATPPTFEGALPAPPIYDIIMANRLAESKYNHKKALHRDVPLKSPSSELAIDNLTRLALPCVLPWSLSTSQTPQQVPPDFSWMTNSCGGKAAIGLFAGGAMGLLMGVFLGAMSDATPPVTLIGGRDVPQPPLREQIKVTMRATAEKSKYWCRQFAFITGVFGGTDCLVEKFRGKHDVWNSVASGCITGAALQAKQGPHAAAVGCGGFAAFSLVIDTVMGTH